MSGPWEPQKYKDDYREAVMKMIDEKIEHGGELSGKPKPARRPTKVIDLVSVLQQSLDQARAEPPSRKKRAGAASAKTSSKASKSLKGSKESGGKGKARKKAA
jgi:DNA end-binding protein Ku